MVLDSDRLQRSRGLGLRKESNSLQTIGIERPEKQGNGGLKEEGKAALSYQSMGLIIYPREVQRFDLEAWIEAKTGLMMI